MLEGVEAFFTRLFEMERRVVSLEAQQQQLFIVITMLR